MLEHQDLALTAYEDGLLFFQRGASDGYLSTAEVLDTTPEPQVHLGYNLGGRLRLLGYDPPPGPLRAGERCRVTYYWQVLDGFDDSFPIQWGVNPESIEMHQTDYVLADRFVGPAGEFSVLHLPMYIQLPPARWQPGQVIRETYDFRLPADAQGEYVGSIGLYTVPRFLGIRLRADRLLPRSEPVALPALTVQP